MRRFTAAAAALGTALGLALVGIGSAEATITAPVPPNTVLAGITPLSSSGGVDNSSGVPLVSPGPHCSGSGKTVISLLTAASGPVSPAFSQQKSSTGAFSVNLDTHTYPNGSYIVRAVETDAKDTIGIFCGAGSTRTLNQAVTITNTVNVQYTGPTSAAQNTQVPISIKLVDPSNNDAGVPNLPVTISLAGGGSASGTTNASGVLSVPAFPVLGPPRTNATLAVSTVGTAFWAAKTQNFSVDVTKNPSTTTLVQPATVNHGQSVSLTANVAATSGSSTPTGTVQFTLDGVNYGAPVAVASGSASTPADTGIATGTHTIGAIYSGDTNITGSSASTKTLTINKAATTTTLTDAPSPTVSGQAVVFTAHVAVVPPGVGTLSGGVQFNIDGAPFGTAVALGAGDNATLTVSNLSTGNHNVTAVYNGNADFASSSSAQLTHGVNKADTTLDLSSSSNPAFSGAPITYTAVVAPVAPGAGNPTGTVQFAVDGVALGAPVALVGGQAVSPVSHQQVSSHAITANYTGDGNFAGQSDSLTQIIVAAQTTTSITSSPNPSVFGQSVLVHAEVTPNAPATGAPTGFIRFVVDGSTYAFVEMVGGAADANVVSLSVGDHTIKAVYLSDDLNFFTSTSPTITQTVNKAATSTALTTSHTPSVFGEPVTYTATVSVNSPGAGAPTGTIVFKDGTTVIGTQPVGPGTGEQASITTGGLSVGQHAISATYSGDDSFLASTKNVAQTVTRAQTTVTLASSANPAQNGEGIQYTATVLPVAPGAGVPTGNVRFFVNGANLGGNYPLVDGVVSSPNFASLTPGTYKISATYNGDGNFVGSTGYLDQGTGQAVTKGNTAMVLSSGPSPSTYGDPVTVSTTVSAVAPATRRPTGVVQIWEGDELLGATSLTPATATNASESSFVTTGLSAGTHSITAVYVGNFNFNPISKATTQVVGQIPTVTGIESSNNPAVYGDTVTFKATVNSSTGTPTGSVTFKEGSTVLGSAPVGDGGQATLAVAGLHTGSHPVKATYSGDVSFGTSTSLALNEVITKAPTHIVAADVNNPGLLAPKANFIRARLTDRYGNPMAGRSISFDAPPGAARPARHLCNAVTNAQGIAECDTQVISIDIGLDLGNEALLDIHGTYDVTYAGDADTIGDSARGHEY